LDKLRLEREAHKIFGGAPDSNILDEYLKKNENENIIKENLENKSEKIFDKNGKGSYKYCSDNDSLRRSKEFEKNEGKSTKSAQEIIQDKIDNLFSTEILNKNQKSFIDSISDWDLKEKIGICFKIRFSCFNLFSNLFF